MGSIQVQRLHSLVGHRDAIYTVIAGHSDREIFSAGGDGMIVRWDLDSPTEGEVVAKLPGSVYALYRLPEGMLVAGQNFEGIHLIDCTHRKELASLKIGGAHIFDMRSNGRDLMVACGDGSVVVVDLDNWTIKERLTYSSKSARSIALNEKTGELAIGYSDHSIRVFDATDYSLKREWMGHANSVFAVSYTPDLRYLLSGSRDAHLKVWDVEAEYCLVTDIVAHMHTINHIEFSPDSKHFVTCSMDKSIKVWDGSEFRLLKVIDKARHAGHGTSVNKLAWTAFDNRLVSASDDRTLSVWDIFF